MLEKSVFSLNNNGTMAVMSKLCVARNFEKGQKRPVFELIENFTLDSMRLCSQPKKKEPGES